MARLNDCSSIPAESVEALKRRFMRQNRELAKTNSNQSIRIRCLESETSRLLAENLALREDIIQLRNDLDHRPDREAIGSVREQLELKMQELSCLVSELGMLQKPGRAAEQISEKPTRSPDRRRSWRRLEMLEEQERRMPTIREDKYYPRLTMDIEELQQVIDTNSESPDLGPPPVAQFHDEDPIKFDPKPSAEADAVQAEEVPSTSQNEDKESDALPAALALNLETRRKRRDSTSKLHIKRVPVFQPSPDTPNDESTGKKSDQLPQVRTGSKRKMSAREDESGLKSTSKLTPEDFVFNRRLTTAAQNGSNPEPASAAESRPASRQGSRLSAKVLAATDRKALGEKSINAELSPKKAGKTSSLEKPLKPLPQPSLQNSARPRSRAGDRKPSKPEPTHRVVHIQPEVITTIEAADLDIASALPPKTPAGFDLFSPSSSQPSTARPVANDTPPPSDLTSASNLAGTEAAGRPGRRARATVNYAEPSLISKMRRPTKELLDAVGKDGRPLKGLIVAKKDSEGNWQPVSGSSRAPSHSVDREDAPSPLGGKTLSSSINTRTTEEAEPGKAISLPDRSASSTAISNFINSTSLSKTRKSTTKLGLNEPSEAAGTDKLTGRKTEEQRKAELAIFDFTESSPHSESSSKAPTLDSDSLSKSRISRRHSSLSEIRSTAADKERRGAVAELKTYMSKESGSEASEKQAGESASAVGSTRSDRAAARRRSMVL